MCVPEIVVNHGHLLLIVFYLQRSEDFDSVTHMYVEHLPEELIWESCPGASNMLKDVYICKCVVHPYMSRSLGACLNAKTT